MLTNAKPASEKQIKILLERMLHDTRVMTPQLPLCDSKKPGKHLHDVWSDLLKRVSTQDLAKSFGIKLKQD